jgi:hypothetical protein
MPLAEIAAALSSLKTAGDMAKALKDVHDATTVQGKVFELQRVILEAQGQAMEAREAQTALVDRVRDLEAELARLKTWDAEKTRYELKMIASGMFAYMLKPDQRGSEPPHWLCPNCFEEGKKSLFQKTRANYINCTCPRCQAAIAPRDHPRWF